MKELEAFLSLKVFKLGCTRTRELCFRLAGKTQDVEAEVGDLDEGRVFGKDEKALSVGAFGRWFEESEMMEGKESSKSNWLRLGGLLSIGGSCKVGITRSGESVFFISTSFVTRRFISGCLCVCTKQFLEMVSGAQFSVQVSSCKHKVGVWTRSLKFLPSLSNSVVPYQEKNGRVFF